MRFSYVDLREGRLRSYFVLQDGDSLFFPVAERFFVSGFVRTPGVYVLNAEGAPVQTGDLHAARAVAQQAVIVGTALIAALAWALRT